MCFAEKLEGSNDMARWIKEIQPDYYNRYSYAFNGEMLWQNGNIYVMDNHRCATWCWLQQCKYDDRYNFMHIDRHYDMSKYYYEEDLIPLLENPHMDYEEYSNLIRQDGEYKSLSWDNYILFAYDLRPDWFLTNVFLTHKEGDVCVGWRGNVMRFIEKEPSDIINQIRRYLMEITNDTEGVLDGTSELKWIVNIDLDIIFNTSEEGKLFEFYDEDTIRDIAKLIQNAMDKIQVLTIAISPEFIAGVDMREKWNNGFKKLKILAEEISFLRCFPHQHLII